MTDDKTGHPKLDVVFRPIQTEQNKITEFYRCVPVLRAADGTVSDAPKALRKGETPDELWAKNKVVLRAGMDGLKTAIMRGMNTKLLLPVHAKCALAKRTATELIALFKEYDASLRKRIMIDAFGLPDELSVDTMDDLTIPLMAVTDKMLAHPPAELDDFKVFSNLNYMGMTLDLMNDEWEADKLSAVLDDFTLNTRHWRLRPFVTGAKTPSILKAVLEVSPYGVDGHGHGADSSHLPIEWPLG